MSLATVFSSRRQFLRFGCGLLVAAGTFAGADHAWALITGGTDDRPHQLPDWPAGAAAVFNSPARVAYWEGPPFGGGNWHAECRGDAKALSAVLADFAKLDVKNRRVVVHDGVGRSFWLDPNREAAKEKSARIDWAFSFWAPKSWERLQGAPALLRGPDAREPDGPPARLDVYADGAVRWADVVVPEGVTVDDHRLSARGFAPADGLVLQGTLVGGVERRPLAGVVRLERLEMRSGDDVRAPVVEASADANGRWTIKRTPAGRHRLVASAPGYVPRVIGYPPSDAEPGWHEFHGRLGAVGSVAGRVVDDGGRPLADVDVQLVGLAIDENDGSYQPAASMRTRTDAAGRFTISEAPRGSGSLLVHKSGYVRPGLPRTVTISVEDLRLEMLPAARLVATVDFGDAPPPPGYLVRITPAGGERVGAWSGSGNLDARRQITFQDVPPGRYVVVGRPNPGADAQETEPRTIDLRGGETRQLEIKAK